jgi:PRTRC genetic system protein F
MLFDPSSTGSEVTVAGERWQSKRAAIAGCRPANDFLTLPEIDPDASTNAVMRWPVEAELSNAIAAQFEAGVLLPGDVRSFTGAGNALGQAFMAWQTRRRTRWQRLAFDFVICDTPAVHEHIQYQYDASDFTPAAPLYLGIEIPEDNVFEIGSRAGVLRKAHPRLVSTAITLINRAIGRTIWIRMPDEFLGMFASWYWDGDTHCTDEQARETLEDRFGEDEQEMEHYLPSAVRPQLCPDDMDVVAWDARRRHFRRPHALGIASLWRLRRFTSGWVRRFCFELEALTLLLRRAGDRNLFDCSYRPECAYAASTLIFEDNAHIGQLLDDHDEHLASSGEGSTFYGFIPFASTPDAIRKQYADWELGLSILNQLDRVLALLSK